MLSSLKILLPTSIFALKFLEWWHASDFARQLSRKAAEGLELPPPIVSGLQGPARAAITGEAAGSLSQDKQNGVASTANQQKHLGLSAPISATTLLPIFTVSLPSPESSELCPICASRIVNATASPSGYVYCYTCIHKWVDGAHDRQLAFMEGGGGDEGWGDEEEGHPGSSSREGRWESGKGRDAVTGRRVLGGTEMLRRVVV